MRMRTLVVVRRAGAGVPAWHCVPVIDELRPRNRSEWGDLYSRRDSCSSIVDMRLTLKSNMKTYSLCCKHADVKTNLWQIHQWIPVQSVNRWWKTVTGHANTREPEIINLDQGLGVTVFNRHPDAASQLHMWFRCTREDELLQERDVRFSFYSFHLGNVLQSGRHRKRLSEFENIQMMTPWWTQSIPRTHDRIAPVVRVSALVMLRQRNRFPQLPHILAPEGLLHAWMPSQCVARVTMAISSYAKTKTAEIKQERLTYAIHQTDKSIWINTIIK